MVCRHMGQKVGKEAPLAGKGPVKGRRPEGEDWVSVFFLINLSAAMENCHRHSAGLFFNGGTQATPFHPPLRGAVWLLPFIPNGPSSQIPGILLTAQWGWQFPVASRAELLALGPWDVLWMF